MNLGVPGRPISIKDNYGLNRQELATAVRAVAANNDMIYRKWVKIHGND